MGDIVLTHRGRFRLVETVHDQVDIPVVRVNTWSARSKSHDRSLFASRQACVLTLR